jgi:hypothetical protein
MIGQYEDPELGKQMVFDIGTLKNDNFTNYNIVQALHNITIIYYRR